MWIWIISTAHVDALNIQLYFCLDVALLSVIATGGMQAVIVLSLSPVSVLSGLPLCAFCCEISVCEEIRQLVALIWVACWGNCPSSWLLKQLAFFKMLNIQRIAFLHCFTHMFPTVFWNCNMLWLWTNYSRSVCIQHWTRFSIFAECYLQSNCNFAHQSKERLSMFTSHFHID